MEFFVYETKKLIKANNKPIIIITSNNEKELPDAFLRRCFFHYIAFPDKETMLEIISVHFPKIKKKLINEALECFFELREIPGLKKKPTTSEHLTGLNCLSLKIFRQTLLEKKTPKKQFQNCMEHF